MIEIKTRMSFKGHLNQQHCQRKKLDNRSIETSQTDCKKEEQKPRTFKNNGGSLERCVTWVYGIPKGE